MILSPHKHQERGSRAEVSGVRERGSWAEVSGVRERDIRGEGKMGESGRGSLLNSLLFTPKFTGHPEQEEIAECMKHSD